MRFCRTVIFLLGEMMKVTILGARGSVPTDGDNMRVFGGATSCIMVEADGSVIFLDAGTGMMRAPDIHPPHATILLTHPHIDHLIGLPFFPYLYQSGTVIDIYAGTKEGLDARAQIDSFLSPPRWPCTIDEYPAKAICHTIAAPFEVDNVKVSFMDSNHPGGSTIFRLDHGGTSLVYATDYEHTDEKDEQLIRFSQDADLLLYDGQYTEEEADEKRGFGHSTAQHGVMIMERCNARLLRLIHHHPIHTDADLLRMEDMVRDDNISFARQGEIICLQK